MSQLIELCDEGIPIHHISPTHVARTAPLFEQAIAFAHRGGHIDVTSGGSRFMPQEQAILHALEAQFQPIASRSALMVMAAFRALTPRVLWKA